MVAIVDLYRTEKIRNLNGYHRKLIDDIGIEDYIIKEDKKYHFFYPIDGGRPLAVELYVMDDNTRNIKDSDEILCNKINTVGNKAYFIVKPTDVDTFHLIENKPMIYTWLEKVKDE